MAHYQTSLRGDVDAFVAHLDQAIPGGSVSAHLEDRFEQILGDARLIVRVYERYSALGGNRVSLNISIMKVGDEFVVSAITSGGSQALFFKINTVGEEAFLTKAVQAIEAWPGS